MTDFESFKDFLPSYLAGPAEKKLFKELEQFPKNLDKRIYTEKLKESSIIHQGDGLNGFMYVKLPDERMELIQGMVLSNTCDISPDNQRTLPPRMIFAPIMNMSKYISFLEKDFVRTGIKTQQYINSHVDDIKRQMISHFFYLPSGGKLENESIVMLDRASNITANFFSNEQIIEKRLFSLSDYGFYLLLYKLSIHFCRIKENVSRTI